MQHRDRAPVTVIGVDIGGTFSDFVVAEGGSLRIHKVPSTPANPADAFLRGVRELEVGPGARFVHGSTVATNALLERRGARAALIASAGFRDVLELGRQTRLGLYALSPTRPEPLIPRERCFEVPERVDRTGAVLEPLDESLVAAVLDRIQASGAESVAVVFLFSFLRPEHERRVGELAAARGLSVSLSSEIMPEYREYERASTTAANAYVAPLMDRYLGRLEERLAEQRPERLQIMQSNGGVISVALARREAVRTVLSGPAGGVVGAWKVAAVAGFERLIGFDMGGTSTDVSLVDGVPRTTAEGGISGLPIRTPMLDIHTVGAGGGSLARLDPGGGLRVGPESAGADPGPAAYGRGDRATVTDANLVLGRLAPASFLGGRMELDLDRAREAVGRIAGGLRLPLEAAAEGIVRVANVQMARAIRRVSVERGYDPRVFCLVAFGGSGPLHACELAEETGIPTVLVPRYPGVLSALGMLLSDVEKEYSRTVMRSTRHSLADLAGGFEVLEARAREDLDAEGIARERQVLGRWLDVRYRGQSYELTVPATVLEPGAIEEALHLEHARRFGYASPGAPGEIVHLRLRATGRVDPPTLPRGVPAGEPASPAERLPAYLEGTWQPVPHYRRADLRPGHQLAGPAVVTQEDATVWLPPLWAGGVDDGYNLVVSRRA